MLAKEVSGYTTDLESPALLWHSGNDTPSGGRQLHSIRTQQFIRIGYQLKCKTIRLNDQYILCKLVTIATSHLVTQIPQLGLWLSSPQLLRLASCYSCCSMYAGQTLLFYMVLQEHFSCQKGVFASHHCKVLAHGGLLNCWGFSPDYCGVFTCARCFYTVRCLLLCFGTIQLK